MRAMASYCIMRGQACQSTVVGVLKAPGEAARARHAGFDSARPEKSFLLLANGRLSAEEIHDALSKRENELLLAFVNGCETSREQSWRRGEAGFGFASAFLSNATFFVFCRSTVADSG
jgi:hypothetical protein